MESLVRLDLGAGSKRFPGWTAVDLVGEPDVRADLRDLPFPDDYADEVRAIHVIEHFYAREAKAVLTEWVRVLKPEGMLAIECPSLDKVLVLATVPQCPPEYVHWALYGDPRTHQDLNDVHKWAYTQMQMVKLLSSVGLVGIRPEAPQFHVPIRDMRIVGFKPPAEQRIVVAHE